MVVFVLSSWQKYTTGALRENKSIKNINIYSDHKHTEQLTNTSHPSPLLPAAPSRPLLSDLAMPSKIKFPYFTLLITMQHNPSFKDHLWDVISLQQLRGGEHGSISIHNHARRVLHGWEGTCACQELQWHAVDQQGEDLGAEEQEGCVDLLLLVDDAVGGPEDAVGEGLEERDPQGEQR